jgi:hypothetical protein
MRMYSHQEWPGAGKRICGLQFERSAAGREVAATVRTEVCTAKIKFNWFRRTANLPRLR